MLKHSQKRVLSMLCVLLLLSAAACGQVEVSAPSSPGDTSLQSTLSETIPEAIFEENSAEVSRIEESLQTLEDENTPEESVETEEERLEREALEAERRYQGFENVFDDLCSRAAVLYRYREDYLGGVVASKNADEELLPASTTKLLTALLLAENITDLSEEVYIPSDFYYEFIERGASMSKYGLNTYVTAEDVLYGILLPSGCDCCVAAARHVSGTDEAFAELMNQRAQELGMSASHFMNSTGLSTGNHYSCAQDMMKLLIACYENDIIRTVMTSSTYTSSSGKELTNGLLIELTPGLLEDVHFLGGKTGYGDSVGRNLCSMAIIGDDVYFLVTLGAYGTGLNHHRDARLVYNAIAEGLTDHTIFVPEEE